MLKIQGRIPRRVDVAFSGGVDSVVVSHFLSRNHKITLHFVHHRTLASEYAAKFAEQFAKSNNLELHIHTIKPLKPPFMSKEEWWRNERYEYFHSLDRPIITCHHLDDCVETWVWSSLHGNSKLMPYRNRNVIRPFLLNEKREFLNWAKRHKLEWSEDASNADTAYIRNHIRHNMMPDILKVNPGIRTTIRKKLLYRGTDV